MKISYRNSPFIKILESQSLLFAQIGEESEEHMLDLMKPDAAKYFQKLCENCKDNIYYCSKNYMQAFELASSKLFEIQDIKEIKPKSYCFIFESKTNPGSKEILMIDLALVWSNSAIVGFANFIDDELCALGDFVIEQYKNDWAVSEASKNGWAIEEAYGSFHFKAYGFETLKSMVLSSILMAIFEQFSEIQTQTIPANGKLQTISCKYSNDTNSKIKMLDIRHFTTIKNDQEFPVRGHFRWQPHGEGSKDRKLIWINDFMKDGYTAPARKLS